VVTLGRLLDAVQARDVALSIETKHPTRYGGRVEQVLVETLARRGWLRETPTARLRLMSFSVLALRRFRRLAPTVPTVYLVEHLPPWRRNGFLPVGTTIAGPSIEILRRDPAYVSRVHAHGGDVHVWTVDSDADIDLCLDLGVDAIISNRPGYVRERLS
jgi:glycerophosphoryl diester phosphodiesterase